uniref:Fucolectin tachylectin-4 pentraxin-1 domain-containing protein n=1 Tax=Hucho hucho TaxID=62062 RepID=A0A4W5LKJ5_9TELE
MFLCDPLLFVSISKMKEVIILSLLGILGMGRCSIDELVNVALRSKAAQSSTFYGGTAKRAIDGIWNSTYEDHSCSHTLGETNPWWRVVRTETYQVTSVTITNRDTLAERINGAEIRIGNSLENNGNSNPRNGTNSSFRTQLNCSCYSTPTWGL